jgi:GNAT superfamily N-acetyltransferase
MRPEADTVMTSAVYVRQATVDDLDVLVPLFDAYREFYRQPSDRERAKRFLLERFEHNQSVIFLSFEGATAIGFTQLYPSFSSGAMARIFILNDLFVAPEARRHGAGAALLLAAAEYARRAGALRLVLSTEVTNATAQSLYEKLGWKRDTAFCVYQLPLKS